MLEALAKADPKNVEAQHDLAFALNERGVALMHLGRLDEAERAFRESVAIRQRLVVTDPDNAEDVREIERTNGHLAEVEKLRNDKS